MKHGKIQATPSHSLESKMPGFRSGSSIPPPLTSMGSLGSSKSSWSSTCPLSGESSCLPHKCVKRTGNERYKPISAYLLQCTRQQWAAYLLLQPIEEREPRLDVTRGLVGDCKLPHFTFVVLPKSFSLMLAAEFSAGHLPTRAQYHFPSLLPTFSSLSTWI